MKIPEFDIFDEEAEHDTLTLKFKHIFDKIHPKRKHNSPHNK